ncbi:MAG: sigma-70 family RNA polymerase sigma factor [Oscillospiraceae bacterium]|jgi:RNA polymerase sporulation-specific sigma factor|nr:sigma-70 family RNA polymerase sigma factor [Oscillospiraceae bacterium]
MSKHERNRLVEDNLGLVHACANRFRGRGVEYDDLYQAGCVGLVKAAEGFDETRGFAFSTYAVPAILGEIKRIFRDGGAVKVGRSAKEKARDLLAQQDALSAKLGRAPSMGELAEHTGLEISEAAVLLCAALPPLSLTAENEDGEQQIDIPSEEKEEHLTEKIALMEALESLDSRDRSMIELRFFKGKTQTETAKLLGMSQVQVSRREKVVLLALRSRLA